MPNANKKWVLLVEDDEINLIIASHFLLKNGINIRKANNGVEAIDILKQNSFDLILMDIEMPIMDGLEATPIIRQMEGNGQIPIVALTAHSHPEKIEEFEQAGMDGYILKPFDQQKMDDMIQKYL